MKVALIYIDKRYIAEKLGIEENQFVFGEIEGSSQEVQFKVFIESDAEVKGVSTTTIEDSPKDCNIRRQRLEDTETKKTQKGKEDK